MAITGVPAYILRSKLRSPAPAVVAAPPRPRIIQALDTDRRVVSLVAPSGFGKTVALSQWFDQVAHPVAWFSVDEIDDDPVLFWAHLTAAVSSVVDDPDIGTIRPVGGRGGLDSVGIARIITTLERLPHALTVVLDGVSSSLPEAVTLGLSLLVKHLDARVRFVFSGQSAPSLPFDRWRAHGWVSEVDERDLALTVEETEDMFATHDVATQVHARLNGWPEGLGLVRSYLAEQRAHAREVVAPHLVDAIVGDQLEVAVLRPLPTTSRDLLGQLAHLDHFDEATCVRHSGEASIAAFEELRHRHLHQATASGTASPHRRWTFGPCMQRVVALAGDAGSAPALASGDGGAPREHHGSDLDALTPRESTLLDLLPTHLTYAEIADELFLSVNTVKANLKSVYRKLGVSSRGEAVRAARTARLLPR